MQHDKVCLVSYKKLPINISRNLVFNAGKVDLIKIISLNLDTLPKPYVPSPVLFFTGREDEIEEITNLITGQSTRLLNIWGSPGFGKTSTAIEVARHLLSLGSPVYFFKLQGIRTVDGFLSKILSIFKSNLADLSLAPIDKLVSILREISSRIFLLFDNLDDLLSSERSFVKLTGLFEELLDINDNINIVFTTRELLEKMRDQIEGFLDIRIRPLHPVSSVKFVRQLLPSFSETLVANVARISSHVPLATKLVTSLVEYNTEDMAYKILEELSLSGNLLDIDSSYEQNMKRLFEIPFEQLALTDKHALISLSVFLTSRISKDAAIGVVSEEMGIAKAVGSLKTLVKKSLIDEDPCRECYSIHPLIHSFVVDKAKQSDFENVFQSASIRFCRYYFLLFERINDDFLSGKSVDTLRLQDTMEHLSIAIHYFATSTSSLENCQDFFRILSRSEIFLFLIGLPSSVSLDISKLYGFAIEKCRTQQYNDTYSKLHVSKYFESIASSNLLSEVECLEIPEHIREDVMLLSDGSAGKLGCYEGISLIVKGNIKSGIECILKHVHGLQNCADQQLIKSLCLQLLALFYTDLKECNKSSELRKEAIEVECLEIPEHIREDVMLLSDGSAGKLGCYEGISLIVKGNIKSGIECIEKHVHGLQNCADQQLIKSLCLQLLALFYTDLKECNKSSELRKEAIEVCKEIGSYNLFLIGNCERTLSTTQKQYRGEQLILFVYLLYMWSKAFLNYETQLYFLNFVHQLEQQLENKVFNASQYLCKIVTYGDFLLAILGVRVGQEVLFDEKITFLKKSVMSDDCCSLTDRTFQTISEMSLSPQRLLNCYTFQMLRDTNESKRCPNVVETCRNALDFSLKQYGKQHRNTAFCYHKIGLAENSAENYISAINAFDQALEIMIACHDGSSSFNADLAEVHIGKGEASTCMKEFESAIASFEEALRIKRKLCNEDTEEIARILVLLWEPQCHFKDLSSGLATLEQALQIRKKVYAENPSSNGYLNVVQCYCGIGQAHNALGHNTESIKCFKSALEVSTDCDVERSVGQVWNF
ncbi:WD repeat-containing alr2800 [Paramuricea clavata]|uniref:WD repeat-containing alr2800 n=1 Tax=Paramuricea clavata TaxID=317549 RepID=A0A7D9L1R3_PARCT|nr:WD repeat-containing alr2800 [Paramuricea clavata]